jgi:hypothetical protein
MSPAFFLLFIASTGAFSWQNGQPRSYVSLIDTEYFVGNVYFDATYDTSKEAELSYGGAGGDFYYRQWRARAIIQLGERADSHLGEAHLGYELGVLEGLRLDIGIFRSFLQRYSYYRAENWSQQVPAAEEALAPLLKGIRLQIFADHQTKIELYALTGWRGRTEINEVPSFAFQLQWTFRDWLSFTSNDYFGIDTPGVPGRFRYHTNKQVHLRYFQDSDGVFNRGAFFLGGDFGFEHGGGVSAFGGSGAAHSFVSAMVHHRLWMAEDTLAWSIGAAYVTNPGNYLVIDTVSEDLSGEKFDAWDFYTTIDVIPEEHVTLRAELAHRNTQKNGETRGLFALLFSM